MCALGNRLDLFQALAEWARRQGGTRIADRARRTVCTRLLCLSSAGHLTVDTAEGRERFVLLPEHAAVPAVEESPFSIAGAARLAPALSLLLDGVTEGFRPGGRAGIRAARRGSVPDDAADECGPAGLPALPQRVAAVDGLARLWRTVRASPTSAAVTVGPSSCSLNNSAVPGSSDTTGCG
ncbi:hypothetical protein ACIBCB_15635 [Streptomyces uncialis]|uniref:hypothetical protein n=1 Tax=Streptomyces uncialis TaxID=1048205 RepID=UPI0037ACD23E